MAGVATCGRGRAAPGFSLMEALVMLVLVSFTSLLMFQMLGSYRIAKERVVAQSGGIDRRALFEAWFRDSVHSLHAAKRVEFQGDARSFSGLSFNSASGLPGAAVEIKWMLAQTADGGWEVSYAEGGRERWRLPLAAASSVSFAYLDGNGNSQDSWPPALGTPTQLPAAIMLLRKVEGSREAVPTLAAVRGPLDPRYATFELEQD